MSDTDSSPEYVQLARIVSTHSLKGEVKCFFTLEDPEHFFKAGETYLLTPDKNPASRLARPKVNHKSQAETDPKNAKYTQTSTPDPVRVGATMRGFKSHKKNGDSAIVKLKEISSIDEARPIIGSSILTKRSAFKSDPRDGQRGLYYVYDIIGLSVISSRSRKSEMHYGFVQEVVNFGAGYMLEIKLDKKHPENTQKKTDLEYYYKNPDTVKKVDLESKTITIQTQER